MEYPFWVNDFDRIKDHKSQYPNIDKIFSYPVSFWFGTRQGRGPIKNLKNRMTRLLNRAHPSLPVLVLYNLPDRDIGQHSEGGATSIDHYFDFVNEFSLGINDKSPILIFEPDALPHSTLMSAPKAKERYNTMATALHIISKNCNAFTYVDIGHSNWLSPDEAGKLINKVSNDNIRGFSVNVSNFRTTKESLSWSLEVGEYTKYNHFVIDTSRNGAGPFGNDWCNPPGRALGTPATTDTECELCDAYLWVKIPGESDGQCNGGPLAGKFWAEYANDLVTNTNWIK